MALFVTCEGEDCAEHGDIGNFYELHLEQPYEEFDDLRWYFCEDCIAEFNSVLPGAEYVEPEEV